MAEKFYFECNQTANGTRDGKWYLDEPTDISFVYDNETKKLAYRKYPKPFICIEDGDTLNCFYRSSGKNHCSNGICSKKTLKVNRVTLNYELFTYYDENSDNNRAQGSCKIKTKRQF